MPVLENESAEVESNGTEVTEESAPEDFLPLEYREYFPSEVASVLEDHFTRQIYGWKRKATLLQAIVRWTDHVSALKAELIEACEGKGRKYLALPPLDRARNGLRDFLSSLSEDKVKEMCTLKNVSYNSFMSTGDKSGLIEALVDEMLIGL